MDHEKEPGFPAIATWNVVFMSGPRASWWDWLTHPKYRHVCAFGYSVTTDTWVIYDVADSHSRISVVTADWFDRWFMTRRDRMTEVLRMSCQSGRDVRMRTGLWCTTAIKHLLGIDSGALRPQALYRDMVRLGARPAFQNERTPESAESLDVHQVKTAAGRPTDESS